MAAITIFSDFGPPKIKSATVSTVSPFICHEVMGLDAMILVFWMLSFKPTFSFSSFTFIKRLFSSSSLSATGRPKFSVDRIYTWRHHSRCLEHVHTVSPLCPQQHQMFLCGSHLSHCRPHHPTVSLWEVLSRSPAGVMVSPPEAYPCSTVFILKGLVRGFDFS